jgi:hypothetical protein
MTAAAIIGLSRLRLGMEILVCQTTGCAAHSDVPRRLVGVASQEGPFFSQDALRRSPGGLRGLSPAIAERMYSIQPMPGNSPTVHHRIHGRTAYGRPDDRRRPEVPSWTHVTCRACLSAGFVEVVVDRWNLYAPEHNAERVLLLLEAVAALVKTGREPRTMRWIVRTLLTQNLKARLPDDEGLRGVPIRRFRAKPHDIPRSSPTS